MQNCFVNTFAGLLFIYKDHKYQLISMWFRDKLLWPLINYKNKRFIYEYV